MCRGTPTQCTTCHVARRGNPAPCACVLRLPARCLGYLQDSNLLDTQEWCIQARGHPRHCGRVQPVERRHASQVAPGRYHVQRQCLCDKNMYLAI